MSDSPTRSEQSPFADAVFRSIWIATLGSNIGILIQSVGASWLMVQTGASAEMIALVQTAASLPFVLFSPLAGALADNMDRRRLMVGAQTALGAVSLTLALLTYHGLVTPWLVLGCTFLLGCGLALNGPAWMASVGDILPRAALPNAVIYNALGLNLARSIGPAIGGAIVAAAGAVAAFFTNAVTALALVLVLLRWRPRYAPRALPPERLSEATTAGFRFVAMSPSIKAVLLRTTWYALGGSFVQAMMPLIARDILGGGVGVFGVLFGAFGVGALSGALASKPLRAAMPPERIVVLATVGVAGSAAIVAVSTTIWLTAPALAVGGAGWVIAFSIFNVSVQLSSPRWVVGRALSLYQMAVYSGIAGGSWLAGLVARHESTSVALFASAGLTLTGLALGIRLPLPQPSVDSPTTDLIEHGDMRATAVPVARRSGPIGITNEYRIAARHVPEFLRLMQVRRRLRSRDGARRWALLRDLDDAELWIERYYFPTWLDYVRYYQRRTKVYESNWEALSRLWEGGTDVVTHRRIERQVGSLPRPSTMPPADAADEPVNPV